MVYKIQSASIVGAKPNLMASENGKQSWFFFDLQKFCTKPCKAIDFSFFNKKKSTQYWFFRRKLDKSHHIRIFFYFHTCIGGNTDNVCYSSLIESICAISVPHTLHIKKNTKPLVGRVTGTIIQSISQMPCKSQSTQFLENKIFNTFHRPNEIRNERKTTKKTEKSKSFHQHASTSRAIR